MVLTTLFRDFFKSEKAGGLILILCTAVSLLLANSGAGESYIHLWHTDVGGKPVEFWINDALMTVFFLLVGLEIEREIYAGELSQIKKAMLPVMAAIGGMAIPAIIHFGFNRGTPFQDGFGIPMATDIAFSIGVLSLLGNRVPASLKVFLVALAIIDDLGAIMVIALFYSKGFSLLYFGLAAALFGVMLVLNRMRMHRVWVYLILGCGLWYCMYRSGIHATISGVLLAFAIPFGNGDERSPSYQLQHTLHKIVAFGVMPLFALANTAIPFPTSFASELLSANSLGIMAGLVIGKPLGIFLFSILGVALGICSVPGDLKKRDIWGIGMLAGIGFTMSIFITLLAFADEGVIINAKMAVMAASLLSGLLGFVWLRVTLKPKADNVVSIPDAP